jgi:calcineurin-like phosphoesterase family protein
MLYFTADTHFCHGRIIPTCGRPFEDVEEMHKTLIANWNSSVSDEDEIYILGDFAYKASGREANAILAQLKGKKYLIKGNHENYLASSDFRHEAFEWEKEYHSFFYGGIKIVLFHYPLLEWDGYYHRAIHLYGHVHNSPLRDAACRKRFHVLGPRAINVGVDAHNFYPVSIQQIMEQANQPEPWPSDR